MFSTVEAVLSSVADGMGSIEFMVQAQGEQECQI
jgi:hypothetical protein